MLHCVQWNLDTTKGSVELILSEVLYIEIPLSLVSTIRKRLCNTCPVCDVVFYFFGFRPTLKVGCEKAP